MCAFKKLEQGQFDQKDKAGIAAYFTPKYGEPIAFGYTADIYRTGDRVLKVFSPALDKALAYREAYVMSCVESAGISMPSILAVREEGGFQLTETEFVEGRDMLSLLFASLAEGDVDGAHALIREMAVLQAQVNRTHAPGLLPYKAYAADRIAGNEHLSAQTRERTLALLAALPEGNGICHGDFHPQNVLIHPSGKRYIIDWVEAGASYPACDPARSYMNLSYLPPVPPLQNPALRLAETYLDAYTSASSLTRQEILDWLPIHAAISYGEKADWYSSQIRAHLL